MPEEMMSEKQVANSAVIAGKAKTPLKPEISSIGNGVVENGTTAEGAKLHPQPTGDALDPLNWSTTTKHVILGIVMFKYFLFTYITTTTVPSLPEIQEQFSVTLSQVNWTVAIPALGLSVGPLFWSSFSDIYGRRMIFIVGTTISLISTCSAAVAASYGGYMAARFFQGFGVSPAGTVGMAVVCDLFFEHERGKKLGLWVLAIDTGLLAGPIFGGFLNEVSAAWINWFNAILFAALLVLELLFMPETLYPRTLMLRKMHFIPDSPGQDVEKFGSGTPSGVNADIPRTKRAPFLNLRPVPGLRHPRPWSSLVRFILTFKQTPVVIAVMGYCFIWYWWVLSVITMLPVAYAEYTPLIQGLLFIGLLLGTLFSEVFFSGGLSDWIVATLAKRNGGTRVAEMRLWLVYPALLVTAVGLILWGVSVERSYHWMVGQVALFLFAAGIQMGNTATSSYIIDSYPLQSMSVITFYAVFLNLSAFINPFFIAPWQEASGWTWTFAAQGIIVFFMGVPLYALLQRYGAALWMKSPQPSWVNPEFDATSD